MLKSISNFKHFEKRFNLISYAFQKLEIAKDVVS